MFDQSHEVSFIKSGSGEKDGRDIILETHPSLHSFPHCFHNNFQFNLKPFMRTGFIIDLWKKLFLWYLCQDRDYVFSQVCFFVYSLMTIGH